MSMSEDDETGFFRMEDERIKKQDNIIMVNSDKILDLLN